MSRKSAYALKSRDPAFAAAWNAAVKARTADGREGDKVNETHDPRNSPGQGDISLSRRRLHRDRLARELFFARLADRNRDSVPLARNAPRQ